MTHKLIIEEYEIKPDIIDVAYYIDGDQSDECQYYPVLRETFDLWLELNGKLKGTYTKYCQVVNDTIDEDWEMSVGQFYQDYAVLKEAIAEYLTQLFSSIFFRQIK